MAVKTIAFMLPWVDPLSANSNLYNAGLIARIETSIADRAITAGKALEINANIFDQQLNTTDSPTFAGLTVDTNTLFVDAVNNRVGIGTASPGQALDVSGITQATRFYVTDGNAVIERSSGALNIQTFAGNNILLQPGGNVGIGTTSPSAKLHVSGATGTEFLRLHDQSNGARLSVDTYDNGGGVRGVTFAVSNDGSTPTDILNLRSTGVGIGTASLSGSGKLTVDGNIVFGTPLARNAADTYSIGIWTAGDPIDNARASVRFNTVAGAASSSSHISFHTNSYGVSSGERVRIDQSGNVGIGTQSANR